MSKLVILFNSKREGSSDSFAYINASEVRAQNRKSKPFFGWLYRSSMWAGADESGHLEFAPLDTVEFDSNKTYVYLIFCSSEQDVSTIEWLWQLPRDQVEKLAHNNVSILFDYSYEDHVPPVHHKPMRTVTDELRLINPTYSGKEIVSAINTLDKSLYSKGSYEMINLPGWFPRLKEEIIKEGYRLPSISDLDRSLASKKKFLYLSLNRSNRIHRVYFLHALKMSGLIPNGIFSFICPIENKHIVEAIWDQFSSVHDREYVVRLLSSLMFDDFLSKPTIIDGPFRSYHNPSDIILPDVNPVYHDSWMTDVCFDVVSETAYSPLMSNMPTITEKSVKPLMFFRPFLMNGEPGSLQRLRDIGFYTFPFVFDELYDIIPNVIDRQRAIIREIQKWVGREEEFMNIMRDHRHVLEHNHNLVMNFPTGKYYSDMILGAINRT